MIEDARNSPRIAPVRPPALASIQSRLMLLVVVTVLLMAVGVGTLSWLAVGESAKRSFQERLALAEANADYLSYVLSQNLMKLNTVASSVDISMDSRELRAMLHDLYVDSVFDDGLYVVDASGEVLVAEPQPTGLENRVSYPAVMAAMSSGKPVISDVYPRQPGVMTISTVVPIKRHGAIIGAVVGDIDPFGPNLNKVLQPRRLGQTGYVELVDHNGIVLASSKANHILTPSDHGDFLKGLIDRRDTARTTCHSGCHDGGQASALETEVMAFAPLPLESAAWGVTVRQSEAEALEPSRSLLRGVLLIGVPLALISLVLAWGMAQSVSRPIVSLTAAARRLSEGNLSDPIGHSGHDEVSSLARSLEDMRSKLKWSVEEIRRWNATLEIKVEERTEELKRLYQELRAKETAREELLHKVITVQEDERKRLARDLHDDTSQTLAALMMTLDTVNMSQSTSVEQARAKLEEVRTAAERAQESVRRTILDLRPSILDDLGLVPALRWYAETRLGQNGIKVMMETNDDDRRLPSEVETTLFRIIQEAATNIVRHAEAENAVIAVDFQPGSVNIEVEDDGNGFDPDRLQGDGTRTFGLQGMRERVSLLGGTILVESEPGSGTRILVSIPLGQREVGDEQH